MTDRADHPARADPRARPLRPYRLVLVGVVLAAALGACGGDKALACAPSQFDVAVSLAPNRVDVSLHNLGAACRFGGTYPVFITSAVRAVRPARATARVPAGATFVQPYAADGGWTCPPNLAGNYQLLVSVEGETVALTDPASRSLAPSIDACMALTPRRSYVRTPA